MLLVLKDRFQPRRGRALQAKIDAGQLKKYDELALLEPEQLMPLARWSLLLLVISGLFFVVLDVTMYRWQMQRLPGGWTWLGVGLWILINIAGYVLILLTHEILHGLAFMLWGGRPYFGTKLPLALYCGAKNQLFHRNQYLVVGLAPLVIISAAGIIVTLCTPLLASYLLFALTGNVSGAVGDLMVALRLWRMPPNILVEDTETGYRAWELGTV